MDEVTMEVIGVSAFEKRNINRGGSAFYSTLRGSGNFGTKDNYFSEMSQFLDSGFRVTLYVK